MEANARVNVYGIRQTRTMARPVAKRAPVVASYSATDYMLAAKIGAALAVAFVSVAAILIF